jgi:hypothetical protein
MFNKLNLVASLMVIAFVLFVGAGWTYNTLQASKFGVTDRMHIGQTLKSASSDTATSWLKGLYKLQATDSIYFVFEVDSVIDTLAVLGVDR